MYIITMQDARDIRSDSISNMCSAQGDRKDSNADLFSGKESMMSHELDIANLFIHCLFILII